MPALLDVAVGQFWLLRTVCGRLRRSSAKRAAGRVFPALSGLLVSQPLKRCSVARIVGFSLDANAAIARVLFQIAAQEVKNRRTESAKMFKKRTLKGQKKSTAPTVAAPAEDTAALDDARFAQEARKRATPLGPGIGGPEAYQSGRSAKEPAADADALGGLGRDFGASPVRRRRRPRSTRRRWRSTSRDRRRPRRRRRRPRAATTRSTRCRSSRASRTFRRTWSARQGRHPRLRRHRARPRSRWRRIAPRTNVCVPKRRLKRRRAVNALPVSSAILPEDRERMLDLPKDDDASLIGKRGPHLWRRGDPAEERRRAQRRGRADRARRVNNLKVGNKTAEKEKKSA